MRLCFRTFWTGRLWQHEQSDNGGQNVRIITWFYLCLEADDLRGYVKQDKPECEEF
jgi:hypothetical protein